MVVVNFSGWGEETIKLTILHFCLYHDKQQASLHHPQRLMNFRYSM